LHKKAQFNDRDFFKKPFTRPEIENLLQGKPAAEMFNFRSPSFKKLDLDREKLSDNDLIELMLAEPRLVRRPVVRIGQKVYFGANSRELATLLE